MTKQNKPAHKPHYKGKPNQPKLVKKSQAITVEAKQEYRELSPQRKIELSKIEIVDDKDYDSNAPHLDLTKGNMLQAWELLNSDGNIMVTGGGGFGKTKLIKEYARLNRGTVMLAPTGTAARLIGGQTIHSFFGINPAQLYEPINPKMFAKKKEMFSMIKTLIIDEISMVRCDLMDIVDKRCQMLTGVPLPFGGIKVILSFDLWQLPPVMKMIDFKTKEMTSEYKIFKEMYDTRYFYGSEVMQRLIGKEQIKLIELTHCFRQGSDLEFASVLNKIRKYEHNQEDLDYLNNSCAWKEDTLANPITIATTKKVVEEVNEVRLAMLETKETKYNGVVEGKVADLPVPIQNTFKLGANVLIKVNDREKNGDGVPLNRYQNGTTGVVRRLEPTAIIVYIPLIKKEVKIDVYEWIDYEYEINREEDTVISTPVGSYKNIPAMVAFALTVHATQGQTLSEVIFEVPAFTEFENGLIYVALSRVTSLAGLALTKKLRMTHFKPNVEVQTFFTDTNHLKI